MAKAYFERDCGRYPSFQRCLSSAVGDWSGDLVSTITSFASVSPNGSTRPAEVPWDERIPYPIFAIACHIFLMDCPLESGPTGVIPKNHTSGQAPPRDRSTDDTLTWNGTGPVPIVAKAGDVSLFVSDVWHRRLPSGEGDPGRFFLQVHYGRRDLAQRIRTTDRANHLSPDAMARATTSRERTLIGLHAAGFYDG